MHTISYRILSLFVLFIAIFSLSKASSLSSLPLMNAIASTDGTVKLLSDTNGYYAYVDFMYNYDDPDPTDYDVFNSNIGKMIIGLYTSQTYLGYNCLGFTSYDCTANSCTPDTWYTFSQYLPYFMVNGYYATASVYLDYNNWYSDQSQNAAIATSCSSSGNAFYGQNRTGILGMGVGNSGTANFKGGQLFSIYLDPSDQTGELTFSVNQDRVAVSNSSGQTLSANLNWDVQFDNYAYFQISGFSGSLTLWISYLNMIFDLDSPTIGLPSSYFATFVQDFGLALGVSCTSTLIYPTCYYTGTMNNLPNISLYAQTQYISIPPQVYLKDGFSYDNTTYLSGITLNLRSLSSSYSGSNYVNSDYNNFIIMGSAFMKYYYTTFDNSTGYPQITFRVAAAPSSGLLWLYILLGAAFLVALIACTVWRIMKKRPKMGSKIKASEQDPLITNNDGNNYQNNQAAPIYDNNAYNNYAQQNYGNYGYNYPQNGGNGYIQQQPQGYAPYSSN